MPSYERLKNMGFQEVEETAHHYCAYNLKVENHCVGIKNSEKEGDMHSHPKSDISSWPW